MKSVLGGLITCQAANSWVIAAPERVRGTVTDIPIVGGRPNTNMTQEQGTQHTQRHLWSKRYILITMTLVKVDV